MRASRLLLCFCLFLLPACQDDPAPERIRRVLDTAVAHAEAGRIGELMDLCAGDFNAHGADKKRIRRILFGYLAGRRGARILHPAYEIRVTEPRLAWVRFPFAFVKGEAAEAATEEPGDAAAWIERWADKARLMRITVDLREEDGEWLLTAGRVERFSGLRFKEIQKL